jgi:hypothetical protein
MPKAIDDHTPRRRGVLGGAVALFAGGAAVPAAAMPTTLIGITTGPGTDPATGTPDADARLLALIAAFHAVDQESEALLAGVDDLPADDPASRSAWARHDEQLRVQLLAMQRDIATTPAQTRQGLAAKAELALSRIIILADGTPDEDAELVASVLHDVLGLPPVAVRRLG